MVSNTYIIHTMIRVKAVHYPSKRGRDGHNFCPSPEHPWPIRGRQPQRPLQQPGISPSIVSNKGMVTLLLHSFCIHTEHKGQEHAHTHMYLPYIAHIHHIVSLSFIILHIPAKAQAIYEFHLHWGANPQQKNITSDKH